MTDRSWQGIEAWLRARIAVIVEVAVEEIDEEAPLTSLGMDSIQAFSLTGELAEWLERDVPLTLLWECQDIRSIAQTLAEPEDDEPVGAEIPSRVIPLNRSADDLPPLDCIAGVNLYHELASRLQAVCPVNGVFIRVEVDLLERSADGRPVSFPSIAEIASAYIDVLRPVRGDGPYRLAGVSFGGVVAFEIARQLLASGADVELIVLLDAILPGATRVHPMRRAVNGMRRLVDLILPRGSTDATDAADGADGAAEIVELRRLAYRKAMLDYAPAPCPVSTLFFRASDRTGLEGTQLEATFGWGAEVVAGWHWIDTPGTHLGLLREPHVADVAGALEPFLRSSASATGQRA